MREIGLGKIFDSYRPEQHYMRGPGPKWHAKYSGLPARPVSEAVSLPLATWLLPAATATLLGLAAVVALA